jgi:hypothetical protein
MVVPITYIINFMTQPESIKFVIIFSFHSLRFFFNLILCQFFVFVFKLGLDNIKMTEMFFLIRSPFK